jgi:hypothetical protein
VIVDFPGEDHGVIERSIDDIAPGGGFNDLETDSYGSEDEGEGGNTQQPEQVVCSRCGFSLSYSFIKVIDSLPVCAACAG